MKNNTEFKNSNPTPITEYKANDNVLVLMDSPDGKQEWRKAEVVRIQTIQSKGALRHPPYPIVMVKVMRTYYRKLKYIYNGIVWVGEDYELFDKENIEGVLYSENICKIN